jgi:hypothetical protein
VFSIDICRQWQVGGTVSPILVRPVREQLEHDRVIRMLQPKYRRKFNVGLNPGSEQAAPVGEPPSALFPDLVLTAPGRGRKLLEVIEVETSESVNSLEAMAEWLPYSRLSCDFSLYVPVASADSARRLCKDLGVELAELWTYSTLGDQLRFARIYHAPDRRPAAPRAPEASRPKPKAVPRKASVKKPAAKRAAAKRPAAKAKPVTRKSAGRK